MDNQLQIEIQDYHVDIYYNGKSISHPVKKPFLEKNELKEIIELLEQSAIPKSSILLIRREQLQEKIPSWGETLYKNLFGEAGGDADKFINAIISDTKRKSLVITSKDSSTLALPWELLLRHRKNTHYFVDYFLEVRRASLSLAFDNTDSKKNQIKKKIRVVSIISRPEGFFDVPFHDISRSIFHIFNNHSVEIIQIRPPTLSVLRKFAEQESAKKEKINFFIFDGHGEIGEIQGKKQAVILFETRKLKNIRTGPAKITSETLSKYLLKMNVELCILNACQTSSIETRTPETAFAFNLSRQTRIPVIGMGSRITPYMAATFSKRFFNSLLSGNTIGKSFKQAQLTLKENSTNTKIGSIGWIAPSLYSNSNFDTRYIVKEPCTREYKYHNLIGRDYDFAELSRLLAENSLLLIYGMIGIGKTSLIREFATYWTMTGGLNGEKTLTIWFDIKENDNYGTILCSIDDVIRSNNSSKLIVVDEIKSYQTGNEEHSKKFFRQLKKRIQSFNNCRIIIINQGDHSAPLISELGIESYEIDLLTVDDAKELILENYRGFLEIDELLPYLLELVLSVSCHPSSLLSVVDQLNTRHPKDLLKTIRSNATWGDKSVQYFELSTYVNTILETVLKLDIDLLVLISEFRYFMNVKQIILVQSSISFHQNDFFPDQKKEINELKIRWEYILKTLSSIGLTKKVTSDYYYIHPVLPSSLNFFKSTNSSVKKRYQKLMIEVLDLLTDDDVNENLFSINDQFEQNNFSEIVKFKLTNPSFLKKYRFISVIDHLPQVTRVIMNAVENQDTNSVKKLSNSLRIALLIEGTIEEEMAYRNFIIEEIYFLEKKDNILAKIERNSMLSKIPKNVNIDDYIINFMSLIKRQVENNILTPQSYAFYCMNLALLCAGLSRYEQGINFAQISLNIYKKENNENRVLRCNAIIQHILFLTGSCNNYENIKKVIDRLENTNDFDNIEYASVIQVDLGLFSGDEHLIKNYIEKLEEKENKGSLSKNVLYNFLKLFIKREKHSAKDYENILENIELNNNVIYHLIADRLLYLIGSKAIEDGSLKFAELIINKSLSHAKNVHSPEDFVYYNIMHEASLFRIYSEGEHLEKARKKITALPSMEKFTCFPYPHLAYCTLYDIVHGLANLNEFILASDYCQLFNKFASFHNQIIESNILMGRVYISLEMYDQAVISFHKAKNEAKDNELMEPLFYLVSSYVLHDDQRNTYIYAAKLRENYLQFHQILINGAAYMFLLFAEIALESNEMEECINHLSATIMLHEQLNEESKGDLKSFIIQNISSSDDLSLLESKTRKHVDDNTVPVEIYEYLFDV